MRGWLELTLASHFVCLAYWRQSAGTKESRNFEPAETNCPCRISPATTIYRKTPLSHWHNPKSLSIHQLCNWTIEKSPQRSKYLVQLQMQSTRVQRKPPNRLRDVIKHPIKMWPCYCYDVMWHATLLCIKHLVRRHKGSFIKCGSNRLKQSNTWEESW